MMTNVAHILFVTGLFLILSGVLLRDCEAVGAHKSKNPYKSFQTGKKWRSKDYELQKTPAGCDFLCSNKTSMGAVRPETSNFTSSMDRSDGRSEPGYGSMNQLFDTVRSSRRDCGSKQSKSFYCERVRWSWWLVKQLEQNHTKLNDYVELVRRNETESAQARSYLSETVVSPRSQLEKLAYKLVTKWGQPADQLVFFELRKYLATRDLKVSIPSIGTALQFGPATPPEGETGRILFDPGFNLKMKLPFFRDEMKFAISTGPSFMAGLGIGMVMLMMKSLFSPMMLAMKAMMLSYFMKDMSPFDFLKVFGFGSSDEAAEEVQQVDMYSPPAVNNPYDNSPDNNGHGGYSSQASNQQQHQLQQALPGYNTLNMNVMNPNAPQKNYAAPPKLNPILPYINPSQQLTAPAYAFYHPRNHKKPTVLVGGYATGLGYTGKESPPTAPSAPASAPDQSSFSSMSSPGPQAPSQATKTEEKEESGFKYVPSNALQLEVENFDPFYSPLLSRIDSIFMHLSVVSEGCRERVVCSIYKSPVKYAPYSNLLSAQLSKHQSELKRPLTTSPKILRYFKYMKAAKDGQGSGDCTQLYPQCDSDTDKLSNLPMVKTYQQLTELMGTGSG